MTAEIASGRPDAKQAAAHGRVDLGRSDKGTYSCFDDEARQAPLTFRWKHKAAFGAVRDEIGGSETAAAVALAVATSAFPISYSRRKEAYAMHRRYRHRLMRYAGVVAAVDHLDRAGLIHHDRAPPGRYGWQSAMTPTDELREIIRRILASGSDLELEAPAETIELRNSAKRPIDYRDSAETRGMRRKIAGFNEALRSVNMSISIRGQLFRAFNETFGRGGRFYVVGGGWQCLPSDQRSEITIDGETVAELDFRAMHPKSFTHGPAFRPPMIVTLSRLGPGRWSRSRF